MTRGKFEQIIQPIYISISNMLSGDIEGGKSAALRIVRECLENGLCDEELRDQLLSLIDNFLMLAKGERSYENLLNYLKSSFYTYRKDLHGLLLLLVREICDERAVSMMKEWASDREPSVRIGSIKCLLKLYEEGKLCLDQLEEFMTDPSPKVREALVSSLQRYCSMNKAEVRSFLSRMLAIERRSSIRTKIITALSETIEEKKHKEKRKGWIRRLFRGR